LAQPPANEQERGFQFSMREKLKEVVLGKSKGLLLVDMAHQMKQLKEDLEKRKGIPQKKKKNAVWGKKYSFYSQNVL